MIPIEKRIPMPPASRGAGHRKYPLDKMAVGDFFFAPISKSNAVVNSTITKYCAKHPGAKFTTRKMTRDSVLGIGVWRLK